MPCRSSGVWSISRSDTSWPAADWGACEEPERLVLADAQTSGGLLLSSSNPGALTAALETAGVVHAVIGEIVDGDPGSIGVRGRPAA